MKKIIKRSLIIMMILGIMGCNNGVAELEKKNEFLQSLVSLGNDFISVFASFGDIVGSVLGFNLESKKSDVGKYFKTVQDTVQGTKDRLNKIVSDMKKEGNPNAAGVESAVNKLVSETLDKIIEGSSEALKGAVGDVPIANVAAPGGGAGSAAGSDAVKFLSEGIKKIVDVVLKEGKRDAGDNKKAEDGNARTANNVGEGEAGKLFAAANAGTSDNAKKAARDALKAVGAVTGADILRAISEGYEGESAKLAKETTGNAATPRDAVIAGGMALRAMAKDGKFANSSEADAQGIIATTIKGTATSSVTKALDTLTISIRKTIDTGFQAVKEAMKINPENTPVNTESGIAIK
ncbi:variable large family protein [Borrelia persica]|uniref:variable large family protein n=1 Tax=Borrelia persica TaxID=44448 RepID=UPI000570D4E2|nr:variable large family protein [Borrelia persica]